MPAGHYQRTRKPVGLRLFSKTTKTPTCWLWNGSRSQFGHGQIVCWDGEKRTLRSTHRVSWELVNGPIPDGLCVLHQCDTPACVNPGHLFLGTKADNSRDMVTKGRQKRGESLPQSKLSPCQVTAIRASTEPYRCLAEKYGISAINVYFIRSRRTWKHLP